MNKRLIALGLALALGGLSTASFAATPGQFYIGAGVGQANWNPDHGEDVHKIDDSDTTANVRFGYVWHWGVDFAVEGGYADLGTVVAEWTAIDSGDVYHEVVKSKELFAGVKVNYHLTPNWYISGRGGIAQARIEDHQVVTFQDFDGQTRSFGEDYDQNHTSWYAGIGIGYDFSRHFGLELAYDYYRNKTDNWSVPVSTVTVGAEYRF